MMTLRNLWAHLFWLEPMRHTQSMKLRFNTLPWWWAWVLHHYLVPQWADSALEMLDCDPNKLSDNDVSSMLTWSRFCHSRSWRMVLKMGNLKGLMVLLSRCRRNHHPRPWGLTSMGWSSFPRSWMRVWTPTPWVQPWILSPWRATIPSEDDKLGCVTTLPPSIWLEC